MKKIHGASVYGEYLEQHLDYSDYVGERERVVGEWFGNLSEDLGVSGPCRGARDPAFRALCDSKHPVTGENLTQYRREDGVRFFDFVGETRKSVSILAVTMGDERLVRAHEESISAGLEELEKFAAYRAGTNAAERFPEITGNVVGARFTHTCARPEAGGGPADPHLHTHCAIANVTKAANGSFYALTESEMLQAIRYASKTYENELAHRVQEIGYKIELRHGPSGAVEGFEISGVSREIMDRFSKRSAAVEKAIEEFKTKEGRSPTDGEISVIRERTKGKKNLTSSNAEMEAQQRAQLSQSELESLQKLINQTRETPRRRSGDRQETQKLGNIERRAIHHSISHVYERVSVAPLHTVLAEALSQYSGRVDRNELLQQAREYPQFVRLTSNKEELAVKTTTLAGLRGELRAIAFARAGKNTHEPFVQREMFRAFNGQDTANIRGTLVDVGEQREIADQVLQSRDRFISLRGVAGAGKTTVLPEIDKGLRAGGYRPLYLAPTVSARDELRARGFKADTVQQFLNEMGNPDLKLPGKTALVIDEAGLASTKQGLAVMKAVKQYDARVIFVGDVKQHTSIEAGDFVRILEKHSGLDQFILDKIHRQKVERYRDAIKLAAAGDSKTAVEHLDKLGWIKEGKGRYIVEAAQELFKLRREHGAQNVLGVAPTHKEGRAVTDVLRKQLQAAGEIGPETPRTSFDSFQWTKQQLGNIDNYNVGQELAITTGKIGPLKQNDTATVESIDKAAKKLTLRTKEGRAVEVAVTHKITPQIQVGETRQLGVAEGDVLLMTSNTKGQKIVNGDMLTVQSVESDGSIRTHEGKIIPADFRHFQHGYVITSHRSQGKTVAHVVVAAEKLGAKEAYVALSRGQISASVHTPDTDELIKRIPQRNEGRVAATDLVAPVLKPKSPPINPKTRDAEYAARVKLAVWRKMIREARHVASKMHERMERVKRAAVAQLYGKHQQTRGNKVV